MPYETHWKHRQSIRLKEYDYSKANAYFITCVTQSRECLFGKIEKGMLYPNELGKLVKEQWLYTEKIRKNLLLDEFVVMPNHLHGIIILTNLLDKNHETVLFRRQPGSLGSIVAGFKSACTKQINQLRNRPGQAVWQRNYYERIIRNEKELHQIRAYILNNPLQWDLDKENPNLSL